MEILTLSNVSKAFGSRKVLRDISFFVEEHSIYGFIGQNGAGKTTAMKMILGLLSLDDGEIQVCGKRVSYGQNQTNTFIGYLPDVPEFYDFMTPKEYLVLCGKVTDMEKKEISKRADELLEMVGLGQEKKRIKSFSRGMKQRLGIAQALFHRPRLLICDEPTSALDPVGRKEILDILVQAKKETTVIFSTHILSDVERICDKIAFLHKGKIVLQGELEEIRGNHIGNDVEFEFGKQEEWALFYGKYPEGKKSGILSIIYEKQREEEIFEKMQFLIKNKICLHRIERLEPDLEDLFMEVVGK